MYVHASFFRCILFTSLCVISTLIYVIIVNYTTTYTQKKNWANVLFLGDIHSKKKIGLTSSFWAILLVVQ